MRFIRDFTFRGIVKTITGGFSLPKIQAALHNKQGDTVDMLLREHPPTTEADIKGLRDTLTAYCNKDTNTKQLLPKGITAEALTGAGMHVIQVVHTAREKDDEVFKELQDAMIATLPRLSATVLSRLEDGGAREAADKTSNSHIEIVHASGLMYAERAHNAGRDEKSRTRVGAAGHLRVYWQEGTTTFRDGRLGAVMIELINHAGSTPPPADILSKGGHITMVVDIEICGNGAIASIEPVKKNGTLGIHYGLCCCAQLAAEVKPKTLARQ